MLQVYHQQRLWDQRNLHNSQLPCSPVGVAHLSAKVALGARTCCLSAPGTAPASCFSLVTPPAAKHSPWKGEAHSQAQAMELVGSWGSQRPALCLLAGSH